MKNAIAAKLVSGLLVLLLAASPSVAHAQSTVYKWVDEDGVVHFGETPPAGVEAERITTDAGPQSVSPVTPASAPASATQAGPTEPEPEEQSPVREVTPISEMSLQELEARCEQAREARIAPLREAEIESCKQDPRNDPEWCVSFNADFGDDGRTVSGAMRPRMFDDLPECVDALNETNRRSR